MEIRIKLYGVLRIDRFKEAVRDFPPGTTVREVLETHRIPGRLLGIVLINGVHSGVEDPLNAGDVLTLLPLLGGG